MDKLPSDVLMLIALEYDMPDLLSMCLTSSKINNTICANETFWMNKLKRDFPQTFDKIIKDNLKVEWKKYYKRVYNVSKGIYTLHKLYTSEPLMNEIMKQYTPKWANPSGLLPNEMNGWALRKDKNNSEIVYLYPSTYYRMGGNQKPKEGENHPNIMLKISFPKPIIEEVPWDESVLGETLFYRRGNGKVSWFNDLYEIMMEYDGGGIDLVFNVYFVIVK